MTMESMCQDGNGRMALKLLGQMHNHKIDRLATKSNKQITGTAIKKKLQKMNQVSEFGAKSRHSLFILQTAKKNYDDSMAFELLESSVENIPELKQF